MGVHVTRILGVGDLKNIMGGPNLRVASGVYSTPSQKPELIQNKFKR